MDGVLLQRDEGAVRVLTFNRPDRANAWTLELEEAYAGALVAAAQDPSVRVVVVTGAGRFFCAGLDAEAAAAISAGGAHSLTGRVRQTVAMSIPKPVIAAVNGPAVGLGLIHALACDVRFAADTAKLSTMFVRRGMPAEHGLAWLVGRLVGRGVASDLLLSGRLVLADEAADLGLVNRAVPAEELMAVTLAYATEMAEACSPAAMADTKAQLWVSFESGLEEARALAAERFAAAKQHPDFHEGIAALVEKRPAAFAGLAADLSVDGLRD